MKLSNNNNIYLEDFRVKDSKVFIGRDRGEDVRIKSKIDDIEKSYSEINIIIPDNIYSISSSFFEELLRNVVIKLGKDLFFEKFKFVSLGEYNYTKSLNEAILLILRK